MRNIKPSQLLRQAKKYLARDESEADLLFGNKDRFICWAIKNAAYDLQHRYDNADTVSGMLCGKIEAAIKTDNPFETTVTSWLDRQGIDICAGDVQKYRHRWLNHLIKTFKEAGQ